LVLKIEYELQNKLLFGIENGNSIAKQIVIGFENGKLKI
jgi:hypothetical protein